MGERTQARERAMGHARLRPLDPGGVELHREGAARRLAGAQPRRDDRPLHRAAGGERQPRQPAPPARSGRRGEFRGLWFADSDIYKVLEAVGWETGRAGDGGWSGWVDDTVALLREVQDDDGYLNSWIQGVRPEQRWQNLHESHELYCAGHLIQAAVAVARGAGRDDLLDVARRFADLAVERFGAEGGEPGLDGHPEIETALVELYRLTGDGALPRRWRRAMVERRGRGLLGHASLRAAVPPGPRARARGHRADRARRAPALPRGRRHRRLPRDRRRVAARRDGGAVASGPTRRRPTSPAAHGSRHRDEAFGDPYELPPDRAYGETCAAIASFHWNWRLLLATGDGRYADAMERALYNAIAVVDRARRAPLLLLQPAAPARRPRRRRRGRAVRAPPVVPLRLLPAEPRAARRLAAPPRRDARRRRHPAAPARRPAGSRARRPTAARRRCRCRPTTRGTAGWRSPSRARRASGRCRCACPPGARRPTVTVDGEPVAGERRRPRLRAPAPRVERAHAGRARAADAGARVIAPHPRIDAVRGCVALARGPLVYCIEQADHPAGVAVEDLRLDPAAPPAPAGADPGPRRPGDARRARRRCDPAHRRRSTRTTPAAAASSAARR